MESQVYENGTFSSCTPKKSPFFGLKFFSDFSETGVLRMRTKQKSVFLKLEFSRKVTFLPLHFEI
jgi:hypothetical protein